MKTTMKDIEDLVNLYSEKASEYCHQLGIAGIGIIWVLNTREYHSPCSSRLLLGIAFLLFVITITVSLIHYFWLATLADRNYHKNEKALNEKNITDIVAIRNEIVEDEPRIETHSWIIFYTKFGALLLAYLITMTFVIINLFNL